MPHSLKSDCTSRPHIALGRNAGFAACAAMLLAGCGGGTGGSGSAPTQDIPAAFDTAARVLSAQAYSLASCVALADDKAKLACYAALGYDDKGDVAKVEALAAAADVMAGKRWQITAPSPGSSDSFQGLATLTFPEIANNGPIAFRNMRVELRCPANWGGPSNQQWSASISLPSDVAYDSNSKERGTMTIDVDGKPFEAVQFSRSTFNILPDQATAFRDAVRAGKAVSATVKTVDGKTGATSAALPNGAGLQEYFAKFCA